MASRPGLLHPNLESLGVRSSSARNLATLGSLQAMKSPPPVDYPVMNEATMHTAAPRTQKPRKQITLKFPDPLSKSCRRRLDESDD